MVFTDLSPLVEISREITEQIVGPGLREQFRDGRGIATDDEGQVAHALRGAPLHEILGDRQHKLFIHVGRKQLGGGLRIKDDQIGTYIDVGLGEFFDDAAGVLQDLFDPLGFVQAGQKQVLGTDE